MLQSDRLTVLNKAVNLKRMRLSCEANWAIAPRPDHGIGNRNREGDELDLI